MQPHGDSTRSLLAGVPHPTPGQPFLPGPALAATYPLDPAGPQLGVDSYGRTDSSTRRLLEAAIGELEGGDCLVFASGMAAISAALLALVPAGGTVVLPGDGYYKTRAWAAQAGFTVVLYPTAGPYPSFAGASLVLLESPANPSLDVCDIAALTSAAHAAGALVAVDNTTATPLGQNPLALGADVVVASATKALTGHSDLLLGYVCCAAPESLARVRVWRDSTGGIPSPFDCWLARRSLSTLDLRLARQAANAAAVAAVLRSHPAVRAVRWPGLADDPAYRLASTQMRRLPGVLTFTLESAAAVRTFLERCALVIPATSFGGLHTTADRRAQWGDPVPEGLVRLSCGIEDTADILADLTAALSVA